MRLLVFDTAGNGCSAGIVVDAEIAAVCAFDGSQAYAERLPGLFAAVLADAGLTLDRLDLLAVTVGPGSFSGIRTGLAAARGLALVTGMKTIPVTTLEALAAPVARSASRTETSPIVAVRDARRGQVFVQRFAAGGRPIERPRLLPPAAVAADLGGPVRLVGEGVPLLLPHLPPDWPGWVEALAENDTGLAGVAMAALAALDRGVEPIDGFELSPLYARDADARPGAGRSLLPVGS